MHQKAFPQPFRFIFLTPKYPVTSIPYSLPVLPGDGDIQNTLPDEFRDKARSIFNTGVYGL